MHGSPKKNASHGTRGVPIEARERGNVPLIVAALLLVIIGVTVFLLLGTESLTPPDAGSTGANAPTTAVEEPPSEGPGAISAEGTESAHEAPDSPAAVAPPVEEESATAFHGRVVDRDGAPLAGAVIRVLPGEGVVDGTAILLTGDTLIRVPRSTRGILFDESTLAQAPSAMTDGDGLFSIAVDDASYLSVVLPGFEPILGRVTERAGAAEDTVREVTTESFGEFFGELGEIRRNLEVGSKIAQWRPTTSEDERRSVTLTPAVIVTGTVLSTVDRSPATGAVVTVREKSDEGLLGQMFLGMLMGSGQGVVNSEGRYALIIDEPGHYEIGGLSGATDFAPTPTDRYRAFEVVEGDVEHVVDLSLEPGGAVLGIVVDASGTPMPGIEIDVTPKLEMNDILNGGMLSQLQPREVETAEDGTFRLGGLPFGRGYSVVAKEEGFARSDVTSEKITARSPVASVELVLVRGATLSGRVVDEAGDPVAGISVVLLPDFAALMESGDFLSMNTAMGGADSDEDGTFAIPHVRAGKYTLRAGEPEYEENPFGTPEGGIELEVDGITDHPGLILVAAAPVEYAIGDLRGQVTDSEGNPIGGAHVEVTLDSAVAPAAVAVEEVSAEVATGEDGQVDAGFVEELVLRATTDHGGFYFIEGGAAPEAWVEVTAEGFGEESTILDPGQTEWNVVLDSVGVIRGRVLLADGTPPQVEFSVGAQEESDAMADAFAAMFAGFAGGVTDGNEDGTFVLDEVPVGRVVVVASATGFAEARSAPFDLRAGEVVEGIELVLRRGAVIFGRVTDPNGAPLAGAKVTCIPASEAGGLGDLLAETMPAFAGGESITTHEYGGYEIPHLSPGEYVIRASHSAYARSKPVSVTVGIDDEIEAPEIAMSVGGKIEGLVTREGTPAPRMMIQVFSSGAMKQGMSDGDGRFTFENLPDDTYTVMAMDITNGMRPGGGTSLRSVEVAVSADHTTEVEITFGTGRTVRGTIAGLPDDGMKMLILRRPGGPAPEEVDPFDMEAAMKSARYQVAMATLGDDGMFEISDVEPGEYILELPRMPSDPTDVEAYAKMDRTPYFRRTIQVSGSDVTVNGRVP